MLEQPATSPGPKIPTGLGPADGYPPMRWYQSGYNIANLATKWQLIPAALRTILASDGNAYVGKLWVVESAAATVASDLGYTPSAQINGVTKANGLVWVNTSQALIHELGHVAHYRANLQNNAALTALFNRAQPNLDDTAYARTNTIEWLAESWCAQIGEPVIIDGTRKAPEEDIWHRAISGFSQEISVRLRMAWRAAYPDLPAFLGGKFDAIPAAGAPTVNAAAIAYRQSDQARLAAGTVLTSTTEVRIRGDGNLPIVSGYPWPTFVWEQYVDGVWTTLASTDPELIVTAPPVGTVVRWRLTATNTNGSVQSTTPDYTSFAVPVFTTHPNPSAQSRALGTPLSFTVAATGSPTWQWQRRVNNGAWENLAGRDGYQMSLVGGAVTPYYLSSANGYSAGNTVVFRCAATNVGGTVYSNPSGIITIT